MIILELKQRDLQFICKKTKEGKYLAVLSSNAIDSDKEIIGESLLKVWGKDGQDLPILYDHKNSMDNLIGYWVNKRCENRDEKTFLIAEADFFEDEPIAEKIKKALNKGKPVGVSVGFMPTNYEEKTINGKNILIWTEGSLREASFVPVQANTDAYAYAMKMWKDYTYQESEVINMTKKTKTSDELQHKEETIEEPIIEEPKTEEVQPEAPQTVEVTSVESVDETQDEEVQDDEVIESVTESEDEKQSEPEPSEVDNSDDNEEKQTEIQTKDNTIVDKTYTELNLKLEKAMSTIENLKQSNKELNDKINKLESLPVRRTLVDLTPKQVNTDAEFDTDLFERLKKNAKLKEEDNYE